MEIRNLDSFKIYGLSFDIFVKNILYYIGYNLLALVLGIIFAIISTFLGILIISISVFFFMKSNYIFGGIFFGLAFSLVLLSLWIIKALFFIVNFYLTKFKIYNDIKFKPTFGLLIKRLIGKALVDFWYFVYFLIPIILFLIGSGILILNIANLSHGYDMGVVGNLLAGLFIGLAVGIYIFLYIRLYLAVYHCFDTEDFSFKNFKKIFDITKGKFLEIVLNIIILAILGVIIFFILKIIFTLIGLGVLFDIQGSIENRVSQVGQVLSNGLSMVSLNQIKGLFIYVFLYWILNFILNILISIYKIIFWFVYYKNLVNSKENSGS